MGVSHHQRLLALSSPLSGGLLPWTRTGCPMRTNKSRQVGASAGGTGNKPLKAALDGRFTAINNQARTQTLLPCAPHERVGNMYGAYPVEADLEHDMPVRHVSGLRHVYRPQGYPREVASGAGSAASQWVPDVEPWRHPMAVEPKIPVPRSQMDLGFEPEEYPRGAGGVRTAEGVNQKRGENQSAVAVLAVLLSLVVLAALGYLARHLLKKRQEGAMLGEASICVRKEDPSPVEKQQNFARITIEIADLSGKSNPGLKRLLSPLTDLFCQPPERSTQPDFCRQSEIADDTRKKPLESGKEKKSTCTCGRAVRLGEQ
ncbi:uncharacterized protein LOC125701014 [Lagopus muta]|uniref:uncharacterized protein LOC125701014 n=1 Tax=Lagopus muta TaxID=64668 RepID=UPI00209FF46E|nr:uncharacterized protein LOC125701014 [Lagopus muta]